MNFPSLSQLRVFEVVSRHATIGKAAEELRIDRTAVSRHVKSLQASLDTVLFNTTPMGIVLTDAGRQYATVIRKSLIEISAATATLNRGPRSGKLNIWSLSGFAGLFLASRIAEFEQMHPSINVTLRPGDDDPDFESYEADIQIRFGPSPASNVRQVELCAASSCLVASPAWLEQNPPLHSITDLLTCRLIDYHCYSFRQWFDERGITGTIEHAGPKMWNAHLALEAAKAGQGVAFATDLVVKPYLAEGSLETIDLQNCSISPQHYMFIARDDLWNDRSVRNFRNWITDILESNS